MSCLCQHPSHLQLNQHNLTFLTTFSRLVTAFPKAGLQSETGNFPGQKIPTEKKKKLTWHNSDYLGNCLLQQKNKVKLKLDGDKEGSATEPDKLEQRCSAASASQQPSTATLWEQNTPEQLRNRITDQPQLNYTKYH